MLDYITCSVRYAVFKTAPGTTRGLAAADTDVYDMHLLRLRACYPV